MKATLLRSLRALPHRTLPDGTRGVFLADTLDPEVSRLLEQMKDSNDAKTRAALAAQILAKLRGDQSKDAEAIAASFGAIDNNTFVDFCERQPK